MLSSIKVDFADLGSGIEPIIRVKAVTTDDPRDSLIKTLFQGGHKYLQIEFVDAKHGENEEGLPTMDKIILLYKPRNSEAVESPYISRFSIGDDVAFAIKENIDKAWKAAKKKNPGMPEEKIEYTPQYNWGKVVAVKFTTGKVWYDIIDDTTNEVHKEIPSHYVKILNKKE